jgi:endonuclease/exonuclease/phosphatase family metal-dependent hydrolase
VTLTVATYNLYLGADLALLFDATSAEDLGQRVAVVRQQLARTDFTARARSVAALLVRERVDVAGLQEVARWTTAAIGEAGAVGPERVEVDFLPVLLAELELAGAAYDVHAVSGSFSGGLPVDGTWMQVTGSNAVLVRRGGALAVTGERSGAFATALELRTGIEGVSFPVHRGWGWVDGEVDGRLVRVVNTHTEAYDGQVRDAQRDELLKLVGEPGCPVVLVGDLNADPSSVGMPVEYADAWPAAGGDPAGGATSGQAGDLANEVGSLRERIDYVFVRGAEVVSCRVVGGSPGDRTPEGLWPSDHAAVVAEVSL